MARKWQCRKPGWIFTLLIWFCWYWFFFFRKLLCFRCCVRYGCVLPFDYLWLPVAFTGRILFRFISTVLLWLHLHGHSLWYLKESQENLKNSEAFWRIFQKSFSNLIGFEIILKESQETWKFAYGIQRIIWEIRKIPKESLRIFQIETLSNPFTFQNFTKVRIIRILRISCKTWLQNKHVNQHLKNLQESWRTTDKSQRIPPIILALVPF